MKRALCLILSVLICAALPACAMKKEPVQDPVNFYYCQQELDYSSQQGVIGKEIRDAQGHRQDYTYLLTLYLQGPEDFSLISPFPAGTAVMGFSIQKGTASIQLNPSFARLTGLNLSLACACITVTVCELADVHAVTISAVDTMLDGKTQITMTRDDLLLLDNSNIVIDPN